MPPELLGPTGALVAVLFGIAALARAIVVLWKEHLEADKDDRAQRDRAIGLLEQLVPSINRMAEAWEARNKADAARRRRNDS